MILHAILDGKKVVPVNIQTTDEMIVWGKFMQDVLARRVAYNNLGNGVEVSTVFLGLDHGYGGMPLWFETMIFGGPHDESVHRYATWQEAEWAHKCVVKALEDGTYSEENKPFLRLVGGE